MDPFAPRAVEGHGVQERQELHARKTPWCDGFRRGLELAEQPRELEGRSRLSDPPIRVVVRPAAPGGRSNHLRTSRSREFSHHKRPAVRADIHAEEFEDTGPVA